MADISSILSALGSAFGGGGNQNIPYSIRNNPLAAAAYNTGTINQRNTEANRAIDQQRANQENTLPIRTTASHLYETLVTYMMDLKNMDAINRSGQMALWQKALGALSQTVLDGDASRLAGLPLTEMWKTAKLWNVDNAGKSRAELRASGFSDPDIDTIYHIFKVREPSSSSSPAPFVAPNTRLTLPGSLGGPAGKQPLPPDPSRLNEPGTTNYQPQFPGDATHPQLQMPGSVTDFSLNGGTFAPGIDQSTGAPYGSGYLGPLDPSSMTSDQAQQLYQAAAGSPEILGNGVVDRMSSQLGQVSPNGIPARAAGGPVPAGQPFLGGEHGSETFVPSQTIGPAGYDTLKAALPGLDANSAPPSTLWDATLGSEMTPPAGNGAATPSAPAKPAAPTAAAPTPAPPVPVPQPTGPPPGPAPSLPNLDLKAAPIPDDPASAAVPGMTGLASSIVTGVKQALESFPVISFADAQTLAQRFANNVYSNPAVINARADLTTAFGPYGYSTPEGGTSSLANYQDAVKGAVGLAGAQLEADLKPYNITQGMIASKLAAYKDAGSALGGSAGLAGGINDATTAGLAPGKASAENLNNLAQASEREQTAYDTAQKAWQEAPNAETKRQLDLAGSRLRDAQAQEAAARGAQEQQDSLTRWQTLQHTIDMDKLKVVDPLTAKMVSMVVHPRMERQVQGQSHGINVRGGIGGGLIGGVLGGVAGALLTGGPGLIPGAIAGAGLLGGGGSLMGGFGTHESTRSGTSNRDMVFDPAIGYALLADPRFHDKAVDLFQGYRNSPNSVDGILPPDLDAALAGSDYVMRDRQSPGFIMQQQRTLQGADLQTFNNDIRAFRSWGSKLTGAGAKLPTPVLTPPPSGPPPGAGGSPAPPGALTFPRPGLGF